ncbi:MAG: PstS family phosphate ABC transporter substrate-binding protein [Acidobacteria bacterium]|nr:PstS family phosphate ABC transporter substrate-binding protein [Acidobacteriota bacterium]
MLTLLAIVAAACGGNDAGGVTNDALKNLSGDLVADGSSTVGPITSAVAEEFQRAGATGVKISVGISGTGGGFKKFCSDQASDRTDISDASRPIKDEEKALCAKNGVEYLELEVATDGLSVMVNPRNNFVEYLTLAELNKIWAPGSRVNNWSQVRAGFPDKPLKLYGAGTDSGTFDYFTDEINGEEGASRSDYTASEDDNVLVQGIAGDANALGYFGYAYYVQNTSKLKLIGIVPEGGRPPGVKPSESTINDGSYKPLSRPLFIYVSKAAIAKPQVKAFIDYYFENVNELLSSVGYIPLHESDFTASKQAWSSASA